MVEIMDTGVDVTDPYAGSDDTPTRQQWRRNRNAAYRLAYEELEGEPHPATLAGGQPQEDLDQLLELTEPPYGLAWAGFGETWDLNPDHPFTPVLRKQSVEAEWNKKQDERREASD